MFQALPPLDWSFLGHDMDFCMATITTCSVLVMRNSFQDAQVLYINQMTTVMDLVQIHLQQDDKTLQVIVKNDNEETSSMCPYLHIFMDKCSSKTPVNHGLVRLLRDCGVETVNPRCHTALVMATSSFDTATAVPMDLPVQLTAPFTAGISKIPTGSTQGVPSTISNAGEKLYGLQDIRLPLHLPPELQWKILSYLSTPSSDLIRAETDRMNLYWTTHFADILTDYNAGFW